MKRIFILLFLLPILSKAQVYQSMPQAGYGAVKRMLFDSVLTLPLGISKLQNISGGRNIGQIRYNTIDSSIYTFSGSAWRKIGGGDTTNLSNRINGKVGLTGNENINGIKTFTSELRLPRGTNIVSDSGTTFYPLIGIDNSYWVRFGTGYLNNVYYGARLSFNYTQYVSFLNGTEYMRLYGDGNLALGNGTFSNSFDKLQIAGDINLKVAGNKIKIATGTNASAGITASLTAGTVVVSTTAVTANSIIVLTAQNTGTSIGNLRVSAKVAGSSFTITSTSLTDNCSVAWLIIN